MDRAPDQATDEEAEDAFVMALYRRRLRRRIALRMRSQAAHPDFIALADSDVQRAEEEVSRCTGDLMRRRSAGNNL